MSTRIPQRVCHSLLACVGATVMVMDVSRYISLAFRLRRDDVICRRTDAVHDSKLAVMSSDSLLCGLRVVGVIES